MDAHPLPNIEDLANEVAQDKYYSSLDLRSIYHQVPLLEEEKFYTAFEARSELFQYNVYHLVSLTVSCHWRCLRAIDCFIKQYQLSKVYAYLDDLTVTGEMKEEHDANLKRLLDAAADCNHTLNEDKSKICVTSLRMLGYLISCQI